MIMNRNEQDEASHHGGGSVLKTVAPHPATTNQRERTIQSTAATPHTEAQKREQGKKSWRKKCIFFPLCMCVFLKVTF